MSDPGLEGSGSKASALAVWAWILYDFSNTNFSTSILTFYFPFWLGAEIGRGSEAVFNFAVAISALLVFFAAPVLGAMADLRQRRVLYLVASP